ncbi:hypothetical protein SAMN05421823_102402 [Catalinimonas alkaloidigena]|uniref:Uncharacterized protein n=1 Tax=Catalinimonas alkaloidigena TaxID=1075417 RepID=A0A1G9AT43_9BACT|nr:YeeE/YedE thiosulfate transporter family protein [Catalinimonas alkaloidigena]SDK30431.1 hypothetical protein SAMN05421823_102402 [Catalinimonas alkaloidigena]
MESWLDWIRQPWPWYVAGPLLGLMVPTLLLLGNKTLGISSSLRHMCAACMPMRIPFFSYNWRQETWNLLFVGGILVGGWLATTFLANPAALVIAPATQADLQALGIQHFEGLLPRELFAWSHLLSARGLVFIVAGGFLVGFGTRYAGGCTSGHTIMGLSNLQWPSLVATVFFMLGGFFATYVLLPPLLSWVLS